MKLILLVSILTSLLLGACATRSRETEVVVPSHDTVVRDQVPTQSGRKIPVVDQY